MKRSNVPLSELPIILHPEVVAAALRTNEGELFAIWTLLKAIDIARDGSGKFRVATIQKLMTQFLGVSERYAYSKVNNGINKYWNKPGGKNGSRVTQIFGRGAVFERLQPDMTRSEPFVFKLRDFEADGEWNWPAIKSLLVGVVASRYVDNRPVSLRAIQECTGLSRRTVQLCLSRCEHLKRITNYAKVHTASSYEEARREHADITFTTKLPHRIELQDGKLSVMRQLPNSYIMVTPSRQPLRKRPKELRLYDHMEHAPLRPKLYYEEEPSKRKPKEFYVSLGWQKFNQVGAVRVWDQKTPESRRVRISLAERALIWADMAVRKKAPTEDDDLGIEHDV